MATANLEAVTAASVPTPAAGTKTLFVDSADGQMKVKDSGGAVTSLEGGGLGDVVGPAGATDGSLALFDGVTGKLLKELALTANGDLLYRNGAGDLARLPFVSNGLFLGAAGGLPAWMAAPGGTVTTVRERFEHFIGNGQTSNNQIGQNGWRTTGNGGGNALSFDADVEAGHPGVIVLEPGTTINGRRAVHLGQNGTEHVLLSTDGSLDENIEIEALVKIVDSIAASDLESVFIGLALASDAAINGRIENGIGVEFVPGTSGNWMVVTASAASRTEDDGGGSAVPVTIDTWFRVGFTFQDDGSGNSTIQLKINGVVVATQTNSADVYDANGLIPMIKIDGNEAVTEPRLKVDYYDFPTGENGED